MSLDHVKASYRLATSRNITIEMSSLIHYETEGHNNLIHLMAGFVVFFHLSEKLFPGSHFKIHFLPHLLSGYTRFITYDPKR